MPFRNDAQRKAAFANMDNPSGSSNPQSDSSSYRPPLLHRSKEPENARNMNKKLPSDYYYPSKDVKPSYATKTDIGSDIKRITAQPGSLSHASDDYDNYKEDVNTQMDKEFDHDYNKLVKKAVKQYRKES
jgi:hypothetical protein